METSEINRLICAYCKEKDRVKKEKIFLQLYPAINNIVILSLGKVGIRKDWENFEDCRQELLIKIVEVLPLVARIRGCKGKQAYLFRVAMNELINILKKETFKKRFQKEILEIMIRSIEVINNKVLSAEEEIINTIDERIGGDRVLKIRLSA